MMIPDRPRQPQIESPGTIFATMGNMGMMNQLIAAYRKTVNTAKTPRILNIVVCFRCLLRCAFSSNTFTDGFSVLFLLESMLLSLSVHAVLFAIVCFRCALG